MIYTKNKSKEYCIDGSGAVHCFECKQKRFKVVHSMYLSYCGVNSVALPLSERRFSWCKKNQFEKQESK